MVSQRTGLLSLAVAVLTLPRSVYEQMVAHCLDAYPYEGCGLLAGPLKTPLETPLKEAPIEATACYPTRNAAASARVYTVDPLDHLVADRDAEQRGLEILGVFHSHTHTDAYPSHTDVDQAPVPEWHYVLVSLALPQPVVRTYRIVGGNIHENELVVQP